MARAEVGRGRHKEYERSFRVREACGQFTRNQIIEEGISKGFLSAWLSRVIKLFVETHPSSNGFVRRMHLEVL